MEETLCKACGWPLAQVAGGHRRREYCNDNCRQAAQRQRREAQCREQVRARWQGFTSETQAYLDWLMQHYGDDHAQAAASTIRRELAAGAIVTHQADHESEVERANVEQLRGMLLAAGQRIAKLEQQVEIQRQRLGQYHQRFYPSQLSVAEEKLLALGAAVGYKRLLKINELTVEIAPGAEAWREFATHADYDTLALAILQVQRFYDNLEAVRAAAKRDEPGESR